MRHHPLRLLLLGKLALPGGQASEVLFERRRHVAQAALKPKPLEGAAEAYCSRLISEPAAASPSTFSHTTEIVHSGGRVGAGPRSGRRPRRGRCSSRQTRNALSGHGRMSNH